jgi:Protein of unknown function (DUF5672)
MMMTRSKIWVIISMLGFYSLLRQDKILTRILVFVQDTENAIVPIVSSKANISSKTSNEPFLGMQQYSYANPYIQRHGCVMTVLLLDPTLKPAVYFSLESVAANVHPINETCILIQTSLCRIQKMYGLEEDSSSYNTAYKILAESIYNASKPLFRRLIELGNVRVSIFNHSKYQTASCDDFRVVNTPFLHIDYWSNYYYLDSEGSKVELHGPDRNFKVEETNPTTRLSGEFVADQDSDFLLVIQDDCVLCHGFDVYSWNHFAFVGAPWHPNYFCNKFGSHWNQWHLAANGNASIASIPPYPTDMCTNPETGPVGNGGLALRSRYWLREVIRYCPAVKYSGLSEQELTDAVCLHKSVTLDSQEDAYFGTILRGFFFNGKNVSMPTVLEAALFSTEMYYFQDHCVHYPNCSKESEESMIKKLWWSGENTKHDNLRAHPSHHEGWNRYERMKKIWLESGKTQPIISIGYHAMHKFQQNKIKNAYHYIVGECPYLEGILPEEFVQPPLQISEN